jgi:IS5 family transposase
MEEKRDPEIHQTKRGNQWYDGMNEHIGVDNASGLIHSVVTTADNVHDLTSAAQLLHRHEQVVYGDGGYQGMDKSPEMASRAVTFRVAMRSGKRRLLPDIADGKLQDLIEVSKTHIRAKVEHPFRVIKQDFGFKMTPLRCLAKNSCKINVLAALTNLFPDRRKLLATA